MTDDSTTDPRPRVGVSSCLLGEPVRHDGAHKRSDAVVECMGPLFAWVPVCPEVEIGLGVPREPLHLVGEVAAPTMLVTRTGEDLTARMNEFASRRIDSLLAAGVRGYVLKSRSPSCGLGTVSVVSRDEATAPPGSALFTIALREGAPLRPGGDELGVFEPATRERFTHRVLAYDEWRRLVGPPPDDDLAERVGDLAGEPPSGPRELHALESRLAADPDAWRTIEERLLSSGRGPGARPRDR